jgi:hypothetical protein
MLRHPGRWIIRWSLDAESVLATANEVIADLALEVSISGQVWSRVTSECRSCHTLSILLWSGLYGGRKCSAIRPFVSTRPRATTLLSWMQ